MAHDPETDVELVTAGTWETSQGFLPTLLVADAESDPWERDFLLLAHPEPLPEGEAQARSEQDRQVVGAVSTLRQRQEKARELGYLPLDDVPGAFD